MLNTVQDVHPQEAEPEELPTLELRKVDFQDIPKLVEMLVEILPTIKTYERIPVEPNRVRTLLQANIDNKELYARVLVENEDFVGVGIGFVTRYAFSNMYHAQDMLLYISPERRNFRTVKLIVEDFCDWSKTMNAKQIFVSNTAGVNAELHARLMSHFGFEVVGHTLVKGVS